MITRAVLPLLVRVGRAELIQCVISAGYLVLAGAAVWLTLGTQGGSPLPIVAGLSIIAGATLAWWLSHRRWHLITDTPTSRVRSAPQGFVELAGQARLLPGQHPLSFNGLPPCVWYEVVVTEGPSLAAPLGSNWVKVSDELFALIDESGQCVIDPDHCEVHGAHERRWSLEGARYRARFLVEGDDLYALGEIFTQRSGAASGDFRAQVADQLRKWKSNPRTMLHRFDSNQDGTVDLEEYAAAVAEAERVVSLHTRHLQTHPEVHLMRSPGFSYPYILSNADPENVARRFRRWAFFHAAIALLTALGVLQLVAR